MPTIRDVAKRAGVSVGTVSHVLNQNNNVKEETRQRVLAAIRELNYHPSAVARSLTTQRTNTIGLIRTDLRPQHASYESDPFVLELIDGISSAAMETLTGLAFWTIPIGSSEMEIYKNLVLSRQIDGLILFAIRDNDPRLRFLKAEGFPFVLFGRGNAPTDRNWLDIDGTYGIQLAVQHLGELGHHRIAYFAPPGEQLLARQRWEGFKQGMTAISAEIDEALVRECDFTERSGEETTHQLLNLASPPTAIVCNNDRMAFGAIRAIQSRGLTVGQDVSVTGFDDFTLARYWHPPLTTIHQPIHEIGQRLFHLLQAVINDESISDFGGQLMKPQLRVRESTGFCPT